MSRRKIVCIVVAIIWIVTGQAEAQHGGMHHGALHGGGGHANFGPQFFGLGAAGFYGGFYGGYAPMLAIGPGGFMPPVGWMGPPFTQGPGPLLPPPPPGMPGFGRNVKRANLKASDHLTPSSEMWQRGPSPSWIRERVTQTPPAGSSRIALILALFVG